MIGLAHIMLKMVVLIILLHNLMIVHNTLILKDIYVILETMRILSFSPALR